MVLMKYSAIGSSGHQTGGLCLVSPVQCWATVGGQMSLQLGQGGEIQATLHAHILLAFLVLQLVGAKLAGVRKPSAAHAAAAGGREGGGQTNDEAKQKWF